MCSRRKGLPPTAQVKYKRARRLSCGAGRLHDDSHHIFLLHPHVLSSFAVRQSLLEEGVNRDIFIMSASLR